jgi:DNA-directed RNA polymerase specialized sigma24 family protein
MSRTITREGQDGRVRVAVDAADDSALDRLRAVHAASDVLDSWQREIITEAREAGASWSEIGEAMGVTKQAAWSAYNADVRAMLERIHERNNDLTEEEAFALIDAEREAIRAERGG